MSPYKLGSASILRTDIPATTARRTCAILTATIAIALLANAANAQVSVSYRPTTLAPGVPHEITITLTDDSGNGLEITGVAFTFQPPQGLTLGAFSWGQFADTFFVDESLPGPSASAFGAGVTISANGSLDVAVVTVTPDTTIAGAENVQLPILPEDAADTAFITGSTLEILDITAGRVAIFTISDSADSQTQDGGGDSPTADGGGSAPPEQGDNDSDSEIDDPDPDDSIDTGDGQDGATTGPNDDEESATGNADDGDAPTSDGQTDDAQDGTTVTPPDDGGDSADDQSEDPPPTTSMCGLGMIGPGLFTIALFSVMRFSRRRVC